MNDADVRLVFDINPPFAVIRFNRPAERNKLSTPTLDELDAALTRLDARDDVRALIFTGTDDVFASGADINELRTLTPSSARLFARRGQGLFQRIADSPRLTVAAINGFCFGGGLDLALACRLRFAAPAATFAHPGATLGIITGWGGTQRLPALVGHARALELFFTARRLSSDDALRWGLVHRVCDSVLDAAIAGAIRHATLHS